MVASIAATVVGIGALVGTAAAVAVAVVVAVAVAVVLVLILVLRRGRRTVGRGKRGGGFSTKVLLQLRRQGRGIVLWCAHGGGRHQSFHDGPFVFDFEQGNSRFDLCGGRLVVCVP